MEEVASFKWLLAPGFNSVLTHILEQPRWTFFPETEGIVDASNVELIDQDGNVFTPAILNANAHRILDERLPRPPPPTEPTKVLVRFNGHGLTLRNPKTGGTTPVNFGEVLIAYSVSHTLSPHRRMRYVDKATGKHITDAVVSEFQVGDRAMRMTIVYKEDEGGQVCLSVAPAKKLATKAKRR
jgi:hypothetical protein